MILTMNLSHNSNMAKSDKLFRKLQLFSAAVYSLAHGMNDAQKTMGIIAMALFKAKGCWAIPFIFPFG